MTTRLLVPLDGSAFSEQALPAVRKLASSLTSCAVELFYVIEPASVPDLAPGTVVPPGYLERAEEWAKHYLEEHAEPLAAAGVDVQEAVSVGPPARVILDRVTTGEFDYVLMATHGRSGLARAVIGSVTDRVMRESAAPVIAVHPQPAKTAEDPWPGDDAPARALIGLFARGDLMSVRAVDVLAKRGSSAVPDLIEALKRGRGSETRQFAARALGTISDPAAIPALVGRLSDDTWEVRWEAEEALVKLGELGVEAVLQALMHAAPDARFHLAVLHVVERAPMELWETLKPVAQALRGSDSRLSAPIEAAKALRKLQEPQRTVTA